MLVCKGGKFFTGPGWLSRRVAFGGVKCTDYVFTVEPAEGKCAYGSSVLINISFETMTSIQTYIQSCLDRANSAVLYVQYDQTPQNAIVQPKVEKPRFNRNFLKKITPL